MTLKILTWKHEHSMQMKASNCSRTLDGEGEKAGFYAQRNSKRCSREEGMGLATT